MLRLILVSFICLSTASSSSANLLSSHSTSSPHYAVKFEWTWISGSASGGAKSVFSAKNVSSSDFTPGGRSGPAAWFDSASKEFWVFGGHDGSARINDLWRYRVTDNTWAWMSGNTSAYPRALFGPKNVSSAEFYPGSRQYSAGFYDSSLQEFWLFGGNGADNTSTLGKLNDLWRYRVQDDTWTWISGSNAVNDQGVYGEKNVPSTDYCPESRSNFAAWYDSKTQEFWIFGGLGISNEMLNDLWRYRLKDNTWTLISGNNTHELRGNYGEKGVPSTENYPGARDRPVAWYDGSLGEFWLFGGYGIDSDGEEGYLNDLWRYRVEDDTWTWIAGSHKIDDPGVSGEKGVPSTDYYPSGRQSSVWWYDSLVQEFWLFGGAGVTKNSTNGEMNDLWRYKMNDGTWTWVAGSGYRNDPGMYGAKNNPSANYAPRARHGSVGWYDSSAQAFWVFGGSISSTYWNDLWKLTFTEVNEAVIRCPDNHTCELVCESEQIESCTYYGSIVVHPTTTLLILNNVVVEGGVRVIEEGRVVLNPGASLEVRGCLIVEEGAELVVIVDESTADSGTRVLTTSNAYSCPGLQFSIIDRVSVESSLDECKYGKPRVWERLDGQTARLELLFEVSDKEECSSRLDVPALISGIASGVLAIVTIALLLSVPRLRRKMMNKFTPSKMANSIPMQTK